MPALPAVPQIVITALETIVIILGAYFVLFWLGLVVWAFRDVRRRTHDVLVQILATLLVLFFHLPGVVIYVMMRPAETVAEVSERTLAEEALLQDMEEDLACPHCHKRAQPDFAVCPYCGEPLKQTCASCGKLLALNWTICPFCATPVQSETPEPGPAEVTASPAQNETSEPTPAEAAPVQEETPEPAPAQETWEPASAEETAEPTPAEGTQVSA